MLVSVVAEKKGTKLGGLLGGLPHTVLVALLFIGINQGADFAAQSAASTILPFIINPFFLWILAARTRYRFIPALGIASLFWVGLILIVRELHLTNIWVNIAIWLVGIAALICSFKRILPVKNATGTAVKFTKRQLVLRALFAGSIIAIAVIAGQYGGAVLGGIFAGFPAGFLSTFVIAFFARGIEFAQSFARTLMLSGAINPTIYAIAVHFLYPSIGLWWGTFIAFGVSLISMQYIVAPLLSRLYHSR